jgi:hypothetical protein
MVLYVECPHCGIYIEIEKINCNIFRCGVYKSNIKQCINPHSSKKECDELKEKDLIYGCGKPFTIKNEKAIICDYI